MKKFHGRLVCVALFTLILLAFLCYSAGRYGFKGMLLKAEEGVIKVFINKSPSTLKPLEADGRLYVPLSFPVEEGKGAWKVTIEYDKAKGIVNIEKAPAREKQRGDTKCSRCDGSKKCQACYPAGSGKNANDGTCSICDGTGKCQRCDGLGSY
jgi:hypothetical protein